ncbi:MAG: hypothetical protein IPN62_19105 [Flavobacteriales bacterium]|nr:hypothetical protein [Flavobacteriales bacterium]
MPGDFTLGRVDPYDEMSIEEFEPAMKKWHYLTDIARLRNLFCVLSTSVTAVWYYTTGHGRHEF